MNGYDDRHVEIIVRAVLDELRCVGDSLIPVEASGRHVHLSREHLEQLFGKGAELTHKRDLSQKGQFLCNERVRLIGARGVFDNVAILGPVRPETQVELSKTDCAALGVKAPLRESGQIKGSAPICVANGDKFVHLSEGAIIAKRHIHMTTADSVRLGVNDGEAVSVEVLSERPVVFKDVIVRVRDDFTLNLHIDFDEANACLHENGVKCRILKG